MRTALLAPVYLGFSWILTISYQLFTNTAVKTIALGLGNFSPAASTWLVTNLSTISFVYAFSWIFILSSVLPSLILGKERSVLVQYLMSMILTVLALSAASVIPKYGGIQLQPIFNSAVFLQRPLFAIVYLVIPYVLMIGLDFNSTKKRTRGKKVQVTVNDGGTALPVTKSPIQEDISSIDKLG